jgi:hypothetical protein
MRNILKSIPGMNLNDLPAARPGPATAEIFAASIDQFSQGRTISRVVLGSEGYPEFRKALLLANNPSYRVALNFLRSPLFGIKRFLPFDFIMGIRGGHFSVIVGYLENQDLVAVFDVNHAYGPFLVNSKRLFDAVNSIDMSSNQTRALIVSEIK